MPTTSLPTSPPTPLPASPLNPSPHPDLDAALDLLVQKLERRLEAKGAFVYAVHSRSPQVLVDRAERLLAGATDAMRLAQTAYNQEVLRVIEADRDAHFARIIEENTKDTTEDSTETRVST
jgi:hypothetical protein